MVASHKDTAPIIRCILCVHLQPTCTPPAHFERERFFKVFREVDDKFGNFQPFQVRDAIQAVASVAATSGFHNIFVCGCAAAALASAFAHLFTIVVGISVAAACVCECLSVLEGTSILLRLFTFGVYVSAAVAFSDVVTLVSGSAFLSVVVFRIASTTAAAPSALVRLLCFLLDLMPLWWGVLGLWLLSAVTFRWCHSLSAGCCVQLLRWLSQVRLGPWSLVALPDLADG